MTRIANFNSNNEFQPAKRGTRGTPLFVRSLRFTSKQTFGFSGSFSGRELPFLFLFAQSCFVSLLAPCLLFLPICFHISADGKTGLHFLALSVKSRILSRPASFVSTRSTIPSIYAMVSYGIVLDAFVDDWHSLFDEETELAVFAVWKRVIS